MEGTYKKSKGNAGQKGVQFQLDLVTVCLLNALRNHKNWKISSENPVAGKYDDIVVELAGEAAVLIQAKHKENRKITRDQFLSDNSKNADFSLPKYFFSYEEVKSKFPRSTVIICTNTAINTKGLEDIIIHQQVQPDNVLYHDSDCSFYSFNGNILPDLKKSAEAYISNNSRNKAVDKTIITDKNLKDFIKNLQIFSCYPCEDHLREIIEQSMSRLSCSTLCRNISSQEILRKVEDWFQQPKGEYLTEARAKAMLCEIRSDKYCESLKDFNVSFANNNLDIPESEKIIHVSTTKGHFLEILKIYHALRGDKRRKLYVNPDDAVEVQKNTVKAFHLRRYTFLIVTWSAIKDEIAKKAIIGELKEILQNSKNRKVILVAEVDDKLAQQFQAQNISHIDRSTTFQDLSEDSQEMLLKRKNVIFQGVTITLQELLYTQAVEDYTKSLLPTMLEELVKGSIIKVGVRPPDLDEDTARYYVSRRFRTKMARQWWARRDINILTEETLYDVKKNIIAISESAGMGKSTVLIKMALIIKKNNPHLWVMKINLDDYTSALRDFVKTKRNKITATELLNSLEATKMTNDFENFVFSMSKRVVLMLDGVDEISPDYTDLALSLLSHCQEAPNFAKVFVATRPHIDLKLTESEQVIMRPLSEAEQTKFLTDYWMYNLNLSYENKEKCKRYATLLINKISSLTNSTYWQNNFTDVPLQVKMLAEIFKENIKEGELSDWEGCKEYILRDGAVPKLPKKFNVAELYDTFIEKKRDVFVEKGSSSGSVTATPALLNQFESYLAYHRSLAVSTLLPELQQLFKTKIPEDSDTEEYIFKIGIVQRLDGRLQFIHRTFAEYFLANCIIQELKLQNPDPNFQWLLIDIILLTYQFKTVRTFLEILLQGVSLPPKLFKRYRLLITREPNTKLIFKLAEDGHVAILRLILENVNFKIIRGRSIDVTDWRLRLPFRKRNTLNDLAVLVRQAGVNIMDEDTSLLELAVTKGHLEMVNFLVQQGANLNVRGNKGDSLMHIAIETGVLDIVAYLVERGLDINVKNSVNKTTLHAAVDYKFWDIVRYLAEQGADVNARDDKGFTVLHVAIELNEIDVAKYLLDHGADINMKNGKNSTGLHLAMHRKNWSVVKYLVDHGAEVNIGDDDGRTVLHEAVASNEMDIVMFLLEHGADVNKKDIKNDTALHIAIYHENLDIVTYLAEHGADVNVGGYDGITALHMAAKYNRLNVVDCLLQHRVDVNAKDDKNCSALYYATLWNHSEIVERLVKYGADVNARNDEGLTVLHVAAKFNRTKVVDCLLQHRVDVNAKDNKNCSALNFATLWNNSKIVERLVKYGADVNARNDKGLTAWHVAAKLNRSDIAVYLLENGADGNVKDS